MRFMKRKLAAALAVLLMLPAQPVWADNTLPQSNVEQSAFPEMSGPETGKDISDTKKLEETSEKTETGTKKPEETSEKAEAETEKPEETSGKTEAETEKPEETSEKTETETTEEVKDAETEGTEEESESQEEMETDPEEEKIINQIVSEVQKQVQKVAKSEKKELLNDNAIATPNNLVKDKISGDEVKFNTGNHAYSVVSRDDFFDKEIGDAYFEEDGSYTINIPEENPFFPYEVQFTYKGKTMNKWFMDPDDSVEVGGHTFRVSAYFDGTVVTQMSFDVAGDTVVVYPEKKEFTDTDEGIAPLSLLPLEERSLTANLTGRSPLELTQVSLADVFTGENALQNGQKVAWKFSAYDKSENYTVSSIGDEIDLSRYTYYGGGSWEMIVGDGDQLTDSNIRYIVHIDVTESEKWLVPTVYTQDADGKRNQIPILDLGEQGYLDGYYDYDPDEREMCIHVSSKVLDRDKEAYIGLQVNSSLFGNQPYDHIKAFEGEYTDSKSAEAGGKDITDQIFAKDMAKKDAGYILESSSGQWVTLVAYDASGKAVACLAFELYLYRMGSYVSWRGPYDGIGSDRSNISASSKSSYSDGCQNVTVGLDYGYTTDKEYS